tara:strand:- start:234 stop:524 length:291 start_codon:yes stop_codon:yes gene_type:complete
VIVARAVKKKYYPQGGDFFETGVANPCKRSHPHACNFVLCCCFYSFPHLSTVSSYVLFLHLVVELELWETQVNQGEAISASRLRVEQGWWLQKPEE